MSEEYHLLCKKQSHQVYRANETFTRDLVTGKPPFHLTQALNHLLDMGPMMADIQDAETESRPSTTDRSFDMREFGAMATKNGTARMASMSTIATSSQSDVKHGSLGRIQAIFRPERGTMSTIKGKSPVRSIYEASMVTDSSRQSHEHICDADDEGLENVRACCGGRPPWGGG